MCNKNKKIVGVLLCLYCFFFSVAEIQTLRFLGSTNIKYIHTHYKEQHRKLRLLLIFILGVRYFFIFHFSIRGIFFFFFNLISSLVKDFIKLSEIFSKYLLSFYVSRICVIFISHRAGSWPVNFFASRTKIFARVEVTKE